MVDSHFLPGWEAVIVHCCCFDEYNAVKIFLLLITPPRFANRVLKLSHLFYGNSSSTEVGQLSQGQAIAIWRSQDPSPNQMALTTHSHLARQRSPNTSVSLSLGPHTLLSHCLIQGTILSPTIPRHNGTAPPDSESWRPRTEHKACRTPAFSSKWKGFSWAKDSRSESGTV